VVLAFAASIVGDTFLSTRAGRESFYIAGIAAFFVAHLGYLGFASRNGRMHRPVLAGLLAGYLGWFAVQLGPAIPSLPLKTAALVYLLISCVTLAAACGLRFGLSIHPSEIRRPGREPHPEPLPPPDPDQPSAGSSTQRALRTSWGLPVKTGYVVGIGLLVFSDTLIALSDFMKVRGVAFLILPTYYLAQVVVTWALLQRDRSSRPDAESGSPTDQGPAGSKRLEAA
jgi:uncharacterized membrane protein YhhN